MRKKKSLLDTWSIKLHSGPLKKADIQPSSPAIKDEEWQKFRRSLKGLSTEDKLKRLRKYSRDRRDEPYTQIQVTNYLNALLRGGQLKR